jgi:uncharacterized membrane protein
MSRLIAGYVSAAAAFLLLDLLWLAVVALPFYRGRIGELLLEKPHLPVGLLFYAVFVIGIVAFAILPGLRAHSRAVQRSLLKVIESIDFRPPKAAARRSCGIVSV